MEVEAVTHALRWFASRGRTTQATILTDSMRLLQKVKRGTGSPDWNVSMVDTVLRKHLWLYCPWHAGVKGSDRADRLADKATLASGLLLGRSEVLRSLRHYLRAQSQGHHTIDCLQERGVDRRSTRRSSLKGRDWGPSSVRWTLELFQRRRWANFWETGWSAYGLFRTHRCHLELNWTQLHGEVWRESFRKSGFRRHMVLGLLSDLHWDGNRKRLQKKKKEKKKKKKEEEKSGLETERSGLAAIRSVAVLGEWKDGIRQKVWKCPVTRFCRMSSFHSTTIAENAFRSELGATKLYNYVWLLHIKLESTSRDVDTHSRGRGGTHRRMAYDEKV